MEDALRLAVCPHDTVRNSEGWYRLVQYLGPALGTRIRFEISLDFADFHSSYAASDLVYANPSDALTLIDTHGFVPLARPVDLFDEALVVASPDAPAQGVEALDDAEVATVVGLVPSKLTLRMLHAKGVAPRGLVARDSWLSVVRSVWAGETPFGILYRDAYEDLSPQGKAMVQVLVATDERCAFHMFCGSPRLASQASALITTLAAMRDHTTGREVLADMRIAGWQAVSPGELDAMRSVLV